MPIPVYTIYPDTSFSLTRDAMMIRKPDVSHLVSNPVYQERYFYLKNFLIEHLPNNFECNDSDLSISLINIVSGDFEILDLIWNDQKLSEWLQPHLYYLTEDYREYEKKALKTLDDDSVKFFDNPLLQPERIIRASDITNSNLIIGENHKDILPKKFLIENMKKLKELGYDTLFLEHIFNDVMQAQLDNYFKSPSGTPLPSRLAEYLKSLDEGQMLISITNSHLAEDAQRYSYTQVVIAAKEAGVRVVGIETVYSQSLQEIMVNNKQKNSAQRLRVLNYTGHKIIAEEINSGRCEGKWITLVGSGHAVKKSGIPGFANIEENAISILIYDEYEKDPNFLKIFLNHKKTIEEQILDCNLWVSGNPRANIDLEKLIQAAKQSKHSLFQPAVSNQNFHEANEVVKPSTNNQPPLKK